MIWSPVDYEILQNFNTFNIWIQDIATFYFKILKQANVSSFVSNKDSSFQPWNNMILERPNELFI